MFIVGYGLYRGPGKWKRETCVSFRVRGLVYEAGFWRVYVRFLRKRKMGECIYWVSNVVEPN